MKTDLILDMIQTTRNMKLEDRNRPLGVNNISGVRIKRLNGKGISYSERHRGTWFKPEYNLEEIQIAQDTDGFLFKAIQKKVNKFILSGWEFVGLKEDSVKYIRKRIHEIELISGVPFEMLLIQTAHDLLRYSNCMWVKVRNESASTGSKRFNVTGKELDPVAGYFVLPFETLYFKVKTNGEIKKILQNVPGTGTTKEFSPDDVIHFYTNKKPGFTMGTPEILPVLEDIALLRRLEENIEVMIDGNLNPLYHYTVGNDNHPERYGPDGVKETDIVKQTIEYMPAGGIYVSDHRHKIDAKSAQPLQVEHYLEYFKKRVFAGLGVSPLDMGEGDSSNSSTAHTLSRSAIQDVEALQHNMKLFIDSFVINELLLEGKMTNAVVEPEERVEIKFGSVDKEEKSKQENQTIQLWLNKLITEDEARKRLGEKPIDESARQGSYYTLYEEPLALLKSMGAFTASSEALIESKTSSITKEGVSKEEQNAEKASKETRGSKPNTQSGGAAQSKIRSSPANQHGERGAPKFNRDETTDEEIEKFIESVPALKIIKILEKLDLMQSNVESINNEISDSEQPQKEIV